MGSFRAVSFALLCVAAVTARARADAGAPKVLPHRSATELVSSNGRAVLGFDLTTSRITSFLEHPYRARSNGAQTRDLAFDVVPGLRVGGAGQAGTWLSDVPTVKASYEPGTGIVHVERTVGELSIDEYDFVPIDLAEHAMVTLLRVERAGGSAAAVDAYFLFNFHLGAGAPEPGAEAETILWDAGRAALMEWGPSGLTLGYGSVGGTAHHGASPSNPYPALGAGSDLADNAGTGGALDDAVGGVQVSLGAVATGSAAWAGAFVVLDANSDVAPRIDAVKTWIAGRTPEQLLQSERDAWTQWHTPSPSGLSSLEAPVFEQQAAILRMGQVSEPGKSDGQLLASLPPGNWNISWVRDMAYATVALARTDHTAEARRAIEFQLGADSGKYQDYVGHPYQISITRYFGDGVEETDSNENGPNIEFDGFGLFLWELAEYVKRSQDDTSLAAWWPTVSEKVADVLVKLQEPGGLITPDSSIWEVHWNGQQKHFAYTTLTAANGLCLAAQLAERVGDGTRATEYREAGRRARDALVSALSAPDGTVAQSTEDLGSGAGFLDAAAIEAAALGLLDPNGKAASATLAAMKQQLVPPSGRGFMRNDDGGWYDSQEWVFVDLRTAVAMRRMNDPAGPELLGWITEQTVENFGLISELHDAQTADYAGEMPMVGFGAGAYLLALLDRSSPTEPAPCGDYAPEPGPDGGVGGSGGTGGSAGSAGSAAQGGGTGSAPRDDGGCGCRAATERRASAAWLALAGLATLWWWRRRRC